MITGLFLLLTFVFFAILKGKQHWAVGVLLSTLGLALVLFYSLATDILKINW
jgi:hypothetical protein